jgi:hypothetical protein
MRPVKLTAADQKSPDCPKGRWGRSYRVSSLRSVGCASVGAAKAETSISISMPQNRGANLARRPHLVQHFAKTIREQLVNPTHLLRPRFEIRSLAWQSCKPSTGREDEHAKAAWHASSASAQLVTPTYQAIISRAATRRSMDGYMVWCDQGTIRTGRFWSDWASRRESHLKVWFLPSVIIWPTADAIRFQSRGIVRLRARPTGSSAFSSASPSTTPK